MPLNRRQWLVSAAAGCGVALAARLGIAQQDARDDVERTAGEFIKPATQASIDKGLAWLASRQNDDGSFGSASGYSRNAGVTGLIGMAFMSSGSMPGRGTYGEHVTGIVR